MTLRERVRWHLNHRIRWFLPVLHRRGAEITLVDHFGSPGDTVLTATVAGALQERFPRLRVRVRTPNPDLLEHDRGLAGLDGRATFWEARFAYYTLVAQRDGRTHILEPTLRHLGLRSRPRRARYVLGPGEAEAASRLLGPPDPRPLVTLNAGSRERVKEWGAERWAELVRRLAGEVRFVQLGDDREPVLPGTERLAGRLTRRESAAVVSQARLHVGAVSFLMHVASGLHVPAVIVFGGRETPANSGYEDNDNLASSPPCSPCWIHDSRGERCTHDLRCMAAISVDEVEAAVRRRLATAGR